jgi:hypothetical protein
MKIYIGNREIGEQDYKKILDPKALNVIAEDSECTSIVLDGVLHKYPINQVFEIIRDCLTKLRIGGNFIIADVDFDLLVYLYKINPDIVTLNNMIDSIGGFKSVVSHAMMIDAMKQFSNLELKVAQSSNVEFKVEYTRKS